VNYRSQIESQFQGKAFERPLFYKHSGGLRFELSEGGTMLEQFLVALQKATEICSEIFLERETITLCLRLWVHENYFHIRKTLTELNKVGISIPKKREIWLETIDTSELSDDDVPLWNVSIVFEIPKNLLQNILWCALSCDMGWIQPKVSAMFYMFNLEAKIMIWPYDDRGMDVVGPNPAALERLYIQFSTYLLEYDREVMDQTFAPSRLL
jgi:hypothetical protein